MKLNPAQHERLAFLCRITQKKILYLLDTDQRLFANPLTAVSIERIESYAS